MIGRAGLLVLAVVIIGGSIAAGYVVDYYQANSPSEPDTFFSPSCVITGIGGFEFRLVSDSTGKSVNADSMSAVDRLGCGNGLIQEYQLVHLKQFSRSNGGWLTPIFPSQAIPAGGLDFTVNHGGRMYSFNSEIPPIGTNCVTLHLPSGNVTTVFVMNGSGSYCS